jgi:Na+-translocating ferredoxin:NAD+ oxidoreductase RnfG subunit
MSDTIIVALLSALGTGAGAIVSAFVSNKVMAVKMEVVQRDVTELKEETRRHNQVIERTYKLEERTSILETRVEGLEGKKK